MTEKDALIILNAIPGITSRLIFGLIKHFTCAQRALQASSHELQGANLLSQKNIETIQGFPADEFLKAEKEQVQNEGVSILSYFDEDYPIELRHIADAPVILYLKGRLPQNLNNSLAIVGSRNASLYGQTIARSFAQQLGERGVHIISGLAKGIDKAAHEGCLAVGATTIAVIGCGHQHVYPQEHKPLYERIQKDGAIFSEYPMDTLPLPYNFPRRNRIISGLSRGVLVVEAAAKSGALITADFAAEQGKNVYAIPGPIDRAGSVGVHNLIKEGARLVTCIDDILEDFDCRDEFVLPTQQKTSDQRLSQEESQVYQFITDRTLHLDEIVHETGMQSSSMARILMALELKRRIEELPGKHFRRIK